MQGIANIKATGNSARQHMGKSQHHPPQNCSFIWGSWTPPNAWFFGPTRVNILTSIAIGSATFAGLMVVTDNLTDRQTVAIGRI